MITAQYVSGKGYTVRNEKGAVVAHSLSVTQKDTMLAAASRGVTGSALLAVIA
jgi:hypothetical protein